MANVPARWEGDSLVIEDVDLKTGIAGAIQQPHIAQIATANATDLASAEALANANKTTLNQLLTALQTAGVLASS